MNKKEIKELYLNNIKLFQKYNDIEVDYDSDNPVFSFWLHKGTYATSFLREIMKSSDVTVY